MYFRSDEVSSRGFIDQNGCSVDELKFYALQSTICSRTGEMLTKLMISVA